MQALESSPPLSIWQIENIPSFHLVWGLCRRNQNHKCSWCGLLLTGIWPRFCCSCNGKYLNDPARLPPLLIQFSAFLNEPCIPPTFNILILYFPLPPSSQCKNFQFQAGSSCICGCHQMYSIYHHVQPDHNNSTIYWSLYDGFLQKLPISYANANWADIIPNYWIDIVA